VRWWIDIEEGWQNIYLTVTGDALSHGADPIPIHQRVSGIYLAWIRISGHSSIPDISIVTDFHQSQFFVDMEKSIISSKGLYGCRNPCGHTLPLAPKRIQSTNHVANQGNVWSRRDTPPECAATDSWFRCG